MSRHPDSPRRAAHNGGKWCRPSTRLAVYLRDGLCCLWCGRGLEDEVALTLDHLTAVAEGGGNEPENLVTACMPCNHRRGATPRDEWCASLGGDVAVRVREHVARDLAPHRQAARRLVAERPAWLRALRARSSTTHRAGR